ncbi:hypothetical protein FACS189490_04720 [Clostridia bacterium]|nr:hypothetical protein FACS189490_04720 [Clostridia bacterium]
MKNPEEVYLGKLGEAVAVGDDWLKKLRLSRRRDIVTGRERLIIEIGEKNSEGYYAEVYCDCYDLQAELLELRYRGVVLTRFNALKLKGLIEDGYYKLPLKEYEPTLTIDSKLNYILETICRYICDNEITATNINGNLLYNIPAKDFTALLRGSELSQFKAVDIRKKLKESEYTYCAAGRSDNTVSNIGKVVSVFADNPEIELIIDDITKIPVTKEVYS